MAPAVRAGDLLFVGGQTAVDGDFVALHRGDVAGQARAALSNVSQLVEQSGGTMADVCDVVAYVRDPRDIDKVLEVATEFFPSDPPAFTSAAMTGTYHEDALLVVRAIAHLGQGEKQCFSSPDLAWLDGQPVSGACRKGSLVFLSGQTAANPDGTVEEPIDHVAQARVAYRRILEHLSMAGASLDDVLDFTSMHHDIRGAEPTFVEVYQPEVLAGVDPELAPTTSHVGMPGLQRPGMLGCYRVLADVAAGGREAYTPDSIWWKGVFPIAGGAKKPGGKLLTIAGQVACGSDAQVVAPGDVHGQARYVLDCMQEILAEAGGSMDDVVEVTSYHKDPRDWEVVTEIAAEYFQSGRRPAWTVVGSSGLWWEGYLHEISALAVLDQKEP
jgi:enamine deaminase RidA (YjgF/YER057c/UK114 family)